MLRYAPKMHTKAFRRQGYLLNLFISVSLVALFCTMLTIEYSILNNHNEAGELKAKSGLERAPKPSLRGTYHEPSVCRTTSSLHSIALEMASFSADAIPKARRVLSSSNEFMVRLMPETYGINEGIFSDVEKNIIKLMEGYGKTLVTESNKSRESFDDQGPPQVISIDNSFYSCLHGVTACLNDVTCQIVAKIVIQTEQVSVLDKLKPEVQQRYTNCIQECHTADNCIVFEYSDYNFKWIEDRLQASSSLLLIPHMIQNRLHYWTPTNLKPLATRYDNAVFFGVVETVRRMRILPLLKRRFARAQDVDVDETGIVTGNIGESRSHTNELMARAYSNSKICFNVHSYSSLSPGEYHRLSEVIPFGCIPVFESFSDTIGIDTYSSCGGVIFVENIRSFHDSLITTLANIKSDRMETRLQWWKDGIHWETLLSEILD